ncbi:MAG: hypothetical protein U9N41_03275, partial [Euryarchaeota archaeon]|nr:hypothetical protein [Euryarchaeota archaeon]
NGLECSHRRTRKAIRERTGRSETNSEMEQFGDCKAFLIKLFFKSLVSNPIKLMEPGASESNIA